MTQKGNIYNEMPREQFYKELDSLMQKYNEFKNKNLKLNMMRGVPCTEQFDLSNDLLTMPLNSVTAKDIGDARSYGGLMGTSEARELFRDLLDAASIDEVMVLGSSSLNIMYDTIAKAMLFGVQAGSSAWGKLEKVKFLCPVPGYDRHFSICQTFGIEMINIVMTDTGPDMDEVERLVSSDASIKGIWCVPKYSNPDGITYSDDTVRRFAALSPAAEDFRIFWDNAYCAHDLTEQGDELLNILEELKKTQKENMVYIFASTAKITFSGSGIAAICASECNIEFMRDKIFAQTICPDKINQLKHVQFLKDKNGIKEQMAKHRKILKPKFDAVSEALENNLKDFKETNLARWTNPNGGYFMSLFVPEGCAKKTIELATELGVAFTPAGSTYPYKKDKSDSNIRIAPTCPSIQDLTIAIEVLCICIKLAYIKKIIPEIIPDL